MGAITELEHDSVAPSVTPSHKHPSTPTRQKKEGPSGSPGGGHQEKPLGSIAYHSTIEHSIAAIAAIVYKASIYKSPLYGGEYV